MLSWLFAVLVLLNAGLFFWGYQREKSLGPPPMPVPEGRYEIRLIGETSQDALQSPDAEAAGAVLAEHPGSGGEARGAALTETDESETPGGAAVGTKEVTKDAEPALEAEQGTAEQDPVNLQAGDTVSEPEGVTEPAGDGALESEKQGDADSAASPSGSLAQSPDGLRVDELQAEAPAPDSGAPASLVRESSDIERGNAAPDEKSGGMR